MTDRPIIFSAPMVRALLDGRKTQTRRVLKPQPGAGQSAHPYRTAMIDWQIREGVVVVSSHKLPYAIGDRLWVREAWRTSADRDAIKPRDLSHDTPLLFEGDDPDRTNSLGLWGRLRPSIHMPRWASRLTLTVTDVRVQRLQEISRDDAIAEGLRLASNQIEEFWRWPAPLDEALWLSPIAAYQSLWSSLHGPAAWDANPWVVALTFTVERRNIDVAAA
jgi:hypothetical protein